ncbi:MAG: sugar ABC transporter permease [bacterium]
MTPPAPPKRSALWLPVAALLVAIGFFAVAWAQARADATAAQASRAAAVARAVAWVHVQAGMRFDDAAETQAQRFVEQVVAKVPGVDEALVLKGVQYEAHSVPDRAKKRLDTESLDAKALYDTARRLQANLQKNIDERARRPELTADPYPQVEVASTGSGALEAIAVANDAGKYVGAARVRAAPVPLDLGLPWLLAAIAAGIALLWLPIARARARLPAAVRLGAGAALLTGLTVAGALTLPAWRDGVRRDSTRLVAETHAALADAGLLAAEAPIDPEDWEDLDDDERREETARREANALVPTLDRALDGARQGALLAIRRAIADATPSPDAIDGTPTSDGAARISYSARDYTMDYADAYFAAAVRQDASDVRVWAIGLGLLGLLVFLLGELGQLRRAGAAAVRHRGAYAYLTPAMLGMLVLVFVPVVFGIYLGFTQRTYNVIEFAGVRNYVEILSDTNFSDPRNFYFKLGVTLMWTALNVGLHVGIGLFLALLLNDQMLKARGIYRVLLIVPWAIPNYITALIWKGMFNKQFGAVNAFLDLMGGEPVSWFQSFWPAFTTNLVTNTWLGFPFMMVVCLGALQSIPTDLYEAAWVDGADRWQRFRQITLPLLMPALVPAVIVGTVWTFNMFNIIYLVSGGAPNGATDILITDAYRWAFERDRYGYAAAYSTVIFLILLGFTLVTNKITGATKGAFE